MLDDNLTEDSDEPVALSVRHKVSVRIDGAPGAGVSDVEFDLKAGETLCVVGAVGAGKSVSALSLTRLAKLDGDEGSEEQTLFDGGDRSPLRLSEPKPKTVRRIRGNKVELIFKDPMAILKPGVVLGRQLADGLSVDKSLPRKEIPARLLEILKQAHVAEPEKVLKQNPEDLPKETLQKALIAQALACAPQLLIADEPTIALNLSARPDCLAHIDRLKRETGLGVLLFTQDLGVVAQMADRVIVMDGGKKIEEGPVANIFQNPQEDHTKLLFSAARNLGDMEGKTAPELIPLMGKPEPIPIVIGHLEDEKPLLILRNLVTPFPSKDGFFFRRKPSGNAVEDASFVLPRGETLALVGEPGCGMSRAARSILGLETPQSGEIFMEGQDIVAMRFAAQRKARADMLLIPRDPFDVLNPKKKLGEQVAGPSGLLGGTARSKTRDRAVELFDRVELDHDLLDRYPREVSRGQCQRVLIARAIAQKPKLIVADNMVSQLDAIEQARALNLLLELQSELGISILFVTQDPAAAERVSHQTAFVHLGRIVEIGSRQAVFEDPHHPLTKLLLTSTPLADPDRRMLNDRPILSPVFPVARIPGPTDYIEVSPGHFVMRKH